MRKARIRLGLTLAQVADRCTQGGVPLSEGQASRIERGLAAGRPETRRALAEVLDLDAYADFEVNPTEPTDPPTADVEVHSVRDGERAVPDDLQELPGARIERSA